MICTFYSYKGGVGRSMALANVASILARRGLRVLMIDFDLEAPGLEQFFPIHQQGIRRELGLLDLLLAYKQAMSLAADEEGAEPSFMRLEGTFLQPVYTNLESGKLDLLHAGQREGEERLARYAYNLRNFDWQDFYFNWAGESFFEWLRQTLVPKLYDIVLVDSRTGVTEMGGICAYQLADTIVMFCAANHQNVEGTFNVVSNFFSQPVLDRRKNRPLQVLVVPSRIEQRDDRLLEDFRERFTARFGSYTPPSLERTGLEFWDLLIPYEVSYAFEERVVEQRSVGEESDAETRPPITMAFEGLAQAIARLAKPQTALGKAAAQDGIVPQAPAEPLYDPSRKFAGYDAFLTYHHADQKAAEEITGRLHQAGARLFLDEWEIVPGEAWQEKAEEALFQSRSCLVLMGSAGIGPWQGHELTAALDRSVKEPGFRVVPVLLPGAVAEEVPDSLKRFTWVDFREGLGDTYAFSRLLAAVQGTAPGPAKATVSQGEPYPGLQPFREQDAPFFFGRETQVQALIDALSDGARLLAVSGASGSGKSSLVQAGLFPALRSGARPGSELWPLISLRAAPNPLTALADTLEPLQLQRALGSAHGWQGRWQPAEGGAGLIARIRGILGPGKDGAEEAEPKLLLFIDQFEEIFSVCTPEQRRSFLDVLLDALDEPESPLLIVIAVRADFLDNCFEEPRLAAVLKARPVLVQLLPLKREDLRTVIERPAQRAGVAFEVGVVERMLDELEGVPGALPLLQTLLQQLWKRQQRGFLTAAAYEEIGGIRGLVASQAEAMYNSLDPTGQEITRRILLRLIHTGEGTGQTSRRATVAELRALHGDQEGIERVLNALANAWLVVIGKVGTEASVQLAHDILIRSWPRVRQWAKKDRQFLLWRGQLRASVQEWQKSGRDSGLLWRGATLEAAESFLRERSADLTTDERSFIAAGVTLERRRRRQVAWTVVAVAAALALIVTLFLRKVSISEEESKISLSRQLAAQSESTLEKDPSLALLLGIEALKASDTEDARRGLLTALDQVASLRAVLNGHTGIVESVALSPDGRLLASGSDDGTSILWDVATRQAFSRSRSDPQHEVDGLAFSSDGKLLALGRGGDILLWDVEAGRVAGFRLRALQGHKKQVESLARIIHEPGKGAVGVRRLGSGRR